MSNNLLFRYLLASHLYSKEEIDAALAHITKEEGVNNRVPKYLGADAEELEATYGAANPKDRPALLRAFCQIDPTDPERRSFCDMLAHDFYTQEEIRRLEHFRDGSR